MSNEDQAMTVGWLREALKRFPDDTPLVIETPQTEFQIVTRINPPCGDEDEAQRAVCFVGGRFV